MTGAQILPLAILGVAVAMFAWGRFRYDAIALGALLAGVLSGAVNPKHAFTGFSGEVVIIIASALVVSAAIARSGVIEPLVQPLVARLKRPRTQVPVLAGATAVLSMLTKNVGALAILMPVAIRMGRAEGSSASALLMPMSFMSLLGGLVTLVGTSTNIIVSEVREQTTGQPFALFDFAPVGLGLTAIGIVFVSFGWRLLPRDRTPRAALGEVQADAAYTTEARIPEDGWPEGIETIVDLDLASGGVKLVGVIAADGSRRVPLPEMRLAPAMVLLLEGDDAALGNLFTRLPLMAARDQHEIEREDPAEELRTVEAVVTTHSPLIGISAEAAALQTRHGAKLIAIGRKGQRITERLREVRLRGGDMLILQASEASLAETMQGLGLLPLAERTVTTGDRRRRYGPALILAIALACVAAKLVTIAVAFFAAAVLVVAIGSLSMREAYGALEPEVLILIGALTPLSEAVQQSGGTALIGGAMASALTGAAPILVLGALLVAAMAMSPFLHNAPTVLVLAPIGVAVAHQLHLNPDAFLMAVAVGAGSDFLTPIGHQCNTLVRGPGGYRFADYARLGAPLSLVVIFAGTPLIAHFWPLAV